MTNTEGLKTLGDYRKAAKDSHEHDKEYAVIPYKCEHKHKFARRCERVKKPHFQLSRTIRIILRIIPCEEPVVQPVSDFFEIRVIDTIYEFSRVGLVVVQFMR